MRVKVHGSAHDICAFCPGTRKQTHIVHGVKQLAVRRLEAVYLRYGAGNYDAHGVWHIV